MVIVGRCMLIEWLISELLVTLLIGFLIYMNQMEDRKGIVVMNRAEFVWDLDLRATNNALLSC